MLDLGCNNHLSENKEVFIELYQTFYSSVKLGDNYKILILGKGRIPIKVNNGSLDYIFEVHYAPNIYQNLLNVAQLAEKCYDFCFNKYKCIVSNIKKKCYPKNKDVNK